MKIGILGPHKENDRPIADNLRIGTEIETLGHEPVYINYRHGVIGLSKACAGLYQYNRSGAKVWPIDVDAVIPRIGAKASHGILALQALELAGVPSTAPSGGLRVAKSKVETKLHLGAAGVPMPDSVIPLGSRPEDTDVFTELLGASDDQPIIIKKDHGSLGKGVTIAESLRSTRSFIDSMPDGPFIMEEFIEPVEETKTTDMRTIVVDNQLVVAMRRTARTTKRKKEFRANLSLSGTGEVYQPTEEEQAIVLNTARAMGLPTVGVDTMHTRDGRTVVTEGNGNFGLKIEQITGVNVAGALAAYAVRLAHGDAE